MWLAHQKTNEHILRRVARVAQGWWAAGRISCGFALDHMCDHYNKLNAGLLLGQPKWNRTTRQAAARSGTVQRSHSMDLIRDIV